MEITHINKGIPMIGADLSFDQRHKTIPCIKLPDDVAFKTR